MADAPHIIARQEVKLHCGRSADALALRQQALSLCTGELPARLNELLNRYDEPGMVLRIGKIAVQVEVSSEQALREELTKAVTEQVEHALRRQLGHSMERSMSVGGSLLEALRFYLMKGFLPWWSLEKEPDAFRAAVRRFLEEEIRPQVATELMRNLSRRDARMRFAGLAGEQGIENLLSSLPLFLAGKWQPFKDSLLLISEKSMAASQPLYIWRELLDVVLALLATMQPQRQDEIADFLRSLTARMRRENIFIEAGIAAQLPLEEWRGILANDEGVVVRKFEAKHPAARQAIVQDEPLAQYNESLQNGWPEEDERMLISSAGLVIVAPFLPAFFRTIGLLEQEQLKEPARAVALLRYILTGDEATDELELVFEKILCGLPLHHSLALPCVLSDQEKQEAMALLQSIIRHWSALKSTSPDGLRHNFLQREGRLWFKAGQWELTVQKQTHDILLDYLPWSISMMKLPWMNALLITKWNV